MTDKDTSRQMTFRPNRRQLVSGMTAVGLLAGAPVRFAQAQKRIPIQEGDFAPVPIAIPNFADSA